MIIYPSTCKLLINTQHRALEFFAFNGFCISLASMVTETKLFQAILSILVLSLDGFRSGVYQILLGKGTAFYVTLHIHATT